jgi:hypothetical protein
LLSDALGGNSLTLLIANISPLQQDIIQSISTLKFAYRAKSVVNMPQKIEVIEGENAEMKKLNAKVSSLAKEAEKVPSSNRERQLDRAAQSDNPGHEVHLGPEQARTGRARAGNHQPPQRE